jgi:hypothetical protein
MFTTVLSSIAIPEASTQQVSTQRPRAELSRSVPSPTTLATLPARGTARHRRRSQGARASRIIEYVSEESVPPPGWPRHLAPPGTPGWERGAARWLYEFCPPEYRAHRVLARHPRLLARLATHHADAAVRAARRGYATARTELDGRMPPEAVDELLTRYAAEGPRLVAQARSVRLVSEALAGTRWRPRL